MDIPTIKNRLCSSQRGENHSRRSRGSRSHLRGPRVPKAHLLCSQMVIDSQDPHLQQVLRNDAVAVRLELFHVPLRVDEAAAEVLSAGEGEIEGRGGRESS